MREALVLGTPGEQLRTGPGRVAGFTPAASAGLGYTSETASADGPSRVERVASKENTARPGTSDRARVGVAAGEVLALLIDGRNHPLATTFAPARLRSTVARREASPKADSAKSVGA